MAAIEEIERLLMERLGEAAQANASLPHAQLGHAKWALVWPDADRPIAAEHWKRRLVIMTRGWTPFDGHAQLKISDELDAALERLAELVLG